MNLFIASVRNIAQPWDPHVIVGAVHRWCFYRTV